jgi:hypothetical protein
MQRHSGWRAVTLFSLLEPMLSLMHSTFHIVPVGQHVVRGAALAGAWAEGASARWRRAQGRHQASCGGRCGAMLAAPPAPLSEQRAAPARLLSPVQRCRSSPAGPRATFALPLLLRRPTRWPGSWQTSSWSCRCPPATWPGRSCRRSWRSCPPGSTCRSGGPCRASHGPSRPLSCCC